jgi:nucleoside 2-deoxyribosyltransferase
MKEVKAYLANQFGFYELGRLCILDNFLIPKLKAIGITINDPFEENKKFFDGEELKRLEEAGLYNEVKLFWQRFDEKVTPTNNKYMQDSDCLLALLDGGHAVDDGVASEIGYYAGIKRGPVFGLRSDFRGGENIGCSINPQVQGYIRESGGVIITPPNAIERWFEEIKKWHDSFSQNPKP